MHSSIRTSTATVGQGKRSVTCSLTDSEGVGEVSESTRTSAAVESQPFQEGTGRASAGIDDNVGSESEPEAPGSGTELPSPPQRLEAWGCADGTPACYRKGE
jgi:hypothetical protein